MKTVEYQVKYINKIANNSIELLNDNFREKSTIILKAPTGSGKTYMISQALSKIVKEQGTKNSYSFIWLSVNSLHEQSRESLTRYLEEERLLDCITIDDLQNNVIEENDIVFINWDSLIKENNVFRMDNEKDWNLHSVISNTKEDGREIILIIDESHRTAKADKALEVINEISPKLTIEMTATPSHINGSLIEIPLAEVIAEGMIKNEIQINPNCKTIKENKDLLSIALNKRKELHKAFKEFGKDINPLLLIQIPNKKQTDSTNPEDYIVGILSDMGITEQNGKLAIRLSGVNIKELDDKVKPNNSEIDVLIFKEAIALGWDCPRASILFLQREWKQDRYSFNIQTLGRIMRMPEQEHYITNPELNIGYVYSASDNFEIVQELASDYVSELLMERDEDLNSKPLKLVSEFIRRKRELTRLSGDFKNCLYESSRELNIKENINIDVKNINKELGVNGTIKEIDKNEKQETYFTDSITIKKDIKEISDSYNKFCNEMTNPYSKARSSNIIKTAIRRWFKEYHGIGDEDQISLIVMHKNNNSYFKRLLEEAKEKYKNLPTKEEEVITNDKWEIPKSISIYTNYQPVNSSKKSIIKQSEDKLLFAKVNKNNKIEFSKPEMSFIEQLDKTDDDILWWFKNGVSESKYFGIAYKKSDNHYYGFYPDFIIKSKKESLIIEIKDDKDYKPENALKLQAGRNYVRRVKNNEIVRFYMLSPLDYDIFFNHLKNQELDSFKSIFEEKLLRYNQSQKKILENKSEQTDKEKEYLDLLSELDKTINELEDEKLKNELLKMELTEAQENIDTLSENLTYIKPEKTNLENIKVPTPFNICVIGEVSNEEIIYNDLNKYFLKIWVKTTEWSIDFFNNTKLQNSNILRSLQKGQSKYNLIVTGQIYHHSGKGNTKANIISELKNEKYIPHIIGSNPKDLLTPSEIVSKINEYLESNI